MFQTDQHPGAQAGSLAQILDQLDIALQKDERGDAFELVAKAKEIVANVKQAAVAVEIPAALDHVIHERRNRADELLRTEPWAQKQELRLIQAKLTSAACSLIHTREHMVDQDHDAFHPLELIEDALVSAGNRLAHLLRVIDPEEPSDG